MNYHLNICFFFPTRVFIQSYRVFVIKQQKARAPDCHECVQDCLQRLWITGNNAVQFLALIFSQLFQNLS